MPRSGTINKLMQLSLSPQDIFFLTLMYLLCWGRRHTLLGTVELPRGCPLGWRPPGERARFHL